MPDGLGSSSNSQDMEPLMNPPPGGNNNSNLTEFDNTVEQFGVNVWNKLEESRKRSRAVLQQSAINDMVHFKRVAIGPGLSFLFAVNELPLNEEVSDGGVPPRTDRYGRWAPPISSKAFRAQRPGRLYRWKNGGTVSTAADCHYYEGEWLSKNATPLTVYRKATMFYCNPWYQFVIATGDVSTRDMNKGLFPDDRWWHLTFRHSGTLSRVDVRSEEQYLAVNGSQWLRDLGLTSNANYDESAPESGGLSGNLAIIIGLVAFTCRAAEFDDILQYDRAWHHRKWNGHLRPHGRKGLK
jgi:hypothetical protein